MDDSDILTQLRTKTFWTDRHWYATRTTWLTLKKHIFNKTDVIEWFSRENMNAKWKFYNSIKLPLFATLLKDVFMGCKNAVLAKLPLENHTDNCLTFERITRQAYRENLCFFCALGLHLQGIRKLEEETSNFFNIFVSRTDGLSPSQFQGVHMNKIPILERLLLLSIRLNDIDFVEENIIGELARRSVQKQENTVRLLRYNNHRCYVSNLRQFSNPLVAKTVTLSSTEHPNWSDIYLPSTNEWKKSISGTCIIFEKFSLTNWTVVVLSTEWTKLFKNLAIFESICVQEKVHIYSKWNIAKLLNRFCSLVYFRPKKSNLSKGTSQRIQGRQRR